MLLFCADSNLVGKTLKENGIEIQIKKETFKEKKTSPTQLVKLLTKATNINLIGNKCVKIAVKKGLALEKDIKKIQGIAHLQIYKVW